MVRTQGYGHTEHMTTPDTLPAALTGRQFGGPDAPYVKIGTVTLLRTESFHYMAQYPGADEIVTCEPQTVTLWANGYYCRAMFTGTITGRGYYGGPLGVEGTSHWRPYTYDVSAFLGHPRPYHADSDIVQRNRDAWGEMFRIDLD